MAETRGRETIAAAYQAARGASDAEAMRRFQNEEACLVLLAIRQVHAANIEPGLGFPEDRFFGAGGPGIYK